MKNDPFRHCPSRWSGILAAAVLCAGCASTPAPTAQLAVSQGAISDALTAGAAELAPLELQHARDKMAQAQSAMAAEKHEEARRLAAEAEVDARLAAAKANTARANLAALEIQKSIRVLRESLTTDAATNQSTPRSMP